MNLNKVMSPNASQTSQDPIQHREHADRLSNLGNSKPAEMNREIGLNLFKDMTLGRRFEDKCAEMYYRGKMFGFVHLYNGQEAISTGVIGACLLYTSPSPRDLSTSRMPSSA